MRYQLKRVTTGKFSDNLEFPIPLDITNSIFKLDIRLAPGRLQTSSDELVPIARRRLVVRLNTPLGLPAPNGHLPVTFTPLLDDSPGSGR